MNAHCGGEDTKIAHPSANIIGQGHTGCSKFAPFTQGAARAFACGVPQQCADRLTAKWRQPSQPSSWFVYEDWNVIFEFWLRLRLSTCHSFHEIQKAICSTFSHMNGWSDKFNYFKTVQFLHWTTKPDHKLVMGRPEMHKIHIVNFLPPALASSWQRLSIMEGLPPT